MFRRLGRRSLLFTASLFAGACGISVVGVGAGGEPEGSTPDASASDVGPTGMDGGAGADAEITKCEADLTRDPKHCGRCGHDCLGGACEDSVCQPSVLAADETGARGVAVIDNELWWTLEPKSALRRMALAGGTITTMPTADAHPTDVAGESGKVFYVDRGAGKVWRWTGTSGELVKQSEPTPSGVSLSGNTLYWARQEQDSVGRLDLGPPPGSVVIESAQNYPADVFVVGTTIYFASGSGILSTPGGTGAPQTILSPTKRFKDGGGDLIHTGLAVIGDTIFFTVGGLGIVASVPTTGGVATVLARDQKDPEGIAATSTAVYWANSGAGTIMRLAR